MALQISFQFPPVLHPTTPSPKPSYPPKLKPTSIFTKPIIKHSTRKSTQFTIKATQFTNKKSEEFEEEEEEEEEQQQQQNPESNNNISEPQIVSNESQPEPTNSEISDLGSQIKKALQEREERERQGGGDFWRGVAEEIREIEWPAFGKVVGTTGVVLGVIAGSSVVLLTVNAVLAELSDRIFAGKGVQDFFG